MLDDYTIKVGLRPDYYEYFPIFGPSELAQRLDSLPFEEATLLGLRNLRRTLELPGGQAGLRSFLRLNYDRQRDAMAIVLRRVGIREDVAAAIGSVPRHLFAPPERRQYSYINHSIHFDSISCLTPPGLVALMLERLDLGSYRRVLEIGIGSGYHAACLIAANPDVDIVGIEANQDYAEYGRRCLRQLGLTSVETIVADARHLPPDLGPFDRVYCTASFRRWPRSVIRLVVDGGLVQGVRSISEQEFNSELPTSWIRTRFPSYLAYAAKDHWTSYSCLSTAIRRGQSLIEIDRLYDVRLTPMVSQKNASKGLLPPNPYDDLPLGIERH
jgi:protein-L-isoaspartate(D-aspartate) O-methyltransferase